MFGCGKGGPTTYRVTGRLVNNGQPVTVPATEAALGSVQIRFLLLAEDGTADGYSFDAPTDAEGAFSVQGATGRGIPPGKYRIAVYQYDPYPIDKLRGAFAEEKTPIVREITGSTDLGTIDLAKPNG